MFELVFPSFSRIIPSAAKTCEPKNRKAPELICAAVLSRGMLRKATVEIENVNPAERSLDSEKRY